MAPERAIASMPVVISAVPIRTRRSVPEQKASAKAARIEYSMIKPPMRTCSSMQSIRMVSKEAGNGDGCGFCAGGLDRAGFFRKKSVLKGKRSYFIINA
ncbi:MAG: hypothetical protein ACLT76_05745 [Clostridium fessum]